MPDDPEDQDIVLPGDEALIESIRAVGRLEARLRQALETIDEIERQRRAVGPRGSSSR